MTAWWHRQAARRRDERGAGMVEMALVFPILALLVLGIFEFGLAWRSSLSVSNALRSGVRTVANGGDDRLADYNGLLAIRTALDNIDGAEITEIVIFDASDEDADIPPACLSGSVTNVCNHYSASEIAALASGQFSTNGATCHSTALDSAWCPLDDRETSQSAAAGLDYVGIYIEVEQDFQTGLFGDGITIKDDATMRIEPQAQQ
jgi:Flp pilus assembly protein TadG